MAGSGPCSLAAVSVSGRWFLFPSRYFAGAVLACVRLSSCVSSVSPVVAAVGLAVAASQRLAAVAFRCTRCLDHNQRQPNEVRLSSAGGEEGRTSTNHQLHQRQQTEPSRSSRFAPSIRLNQVERPRAPGAPGWRLSRRLLRSSQFERAPASRHRMRATKPMPSAIRTPPDRFVRARLRCSSRASLPLTPRLARLLQPLECALPLRSGQRQSQ